MSESTSLSAEFLKDFTTLPTWTDIPSMFMGVRDPNLVITDYAFIEKDIESIKWVPTIYQISFDSDSHKFEYDKLEDSSCVKDTVVNDNMGGNFTLVSLYDACNASRVTRPWILGEGTDQAAYYGICTARNKNIATYTVTSLMSTPIKRGSGGEGEGEGGEDNPPETQGKVRLKDTDCTSSDALGFLDQKLVSYDDTQDIPEGYDEVTAEALNFGVVFDVSKRSPAPCMPDIPLEPGEEVSEHKVLVGHVEIPKEYFATNGRVSLGTADCSTDDTPGYLDQKLTVAEGEDYIELERSIQKVPDPCHGDGGTMFALCLGLWKDAVYPSLNLGPLENIYTTNTSEESPQKNIKIERKDSKYGFLYDNGSDVELVDDLMPAFTAGPGLLWHHDNRELSVDMEYIIKYILDNYTTSCD